MPGLPYRTQPSQIFRVWPLGLPRCGLASRPMRPRPAIDWAFACLVSMPRTRDIAHGMRLPSFWASAAHPASLFSPSPNLKMVFGSLGNILGPLWSGYAKSLHLLYGVLIIMWVIELITTLVSIILSVVASYSGEFSAKFRLG